MKRVLVAPLDWGLGHATRCIPIIRELLLRNCAVYIASSGDALMLLQNEFPDLPSFHLSAYRPVYSSKANMLLKMATQLGKFIRVIKEEHKQIEEIVTEHQINLVIADNRYGCWSAKVPSIFITHQLTILMPAGFRWLEKVIHYINAKLIGKFTACWVPDDGDRQNSLSGKLSSYQKQYFHAVDYIGPLSRLQCDPVQNIHYDILFILSGPEPQRSIFEKIATAQLEKSGLRYYVVRGVFLSNSPGNAFHTSENLQLLISRSKVILARSGYSTIMDLVATGKKAILVPTPGQTEQEYLAKRWFIKKVFYTGCQNNFDLERAWKEVNAFSGLKIGRERSPTRLQQALDKVL